MLDPEKYRPSSGDGLIQNLTLLFSWINRLLKSGLSKLRLREDRCEIQTLSYQRMIQTFVCFNSHCYADIAEEMPNSRS